MYPTSHIPYPISCFLFLTSCLLFLASCSTTTPEHNQETFSPAIVWPLPPEQARIGYEGKLERPDDAGTKKGFFRRIFEFLAGETAERIVKPYGITVDSAGRIIVADTAFKRLHIFDKKEGHYTWIDEFNDIGFVSPIGVAVDNQDNIYVSDSELSKIFIFNKKGKLLFEITQNISRPTGIAINKDEGFLYVVNTLEHNISVYNLSGKYLYVFGSRGKENGTFNFPTDIFVDKQGSVYVTDSLNFRIQLFNKHGKFISMFGRQGDGSGNFARPKGVAVDIYGHIYVVDALFDAVQIFDRDGRYLLGFGSSGQGSGNFWLPSGIFIDSKNSIYVSDSFNRRVQIFRYIGGEIIENKK